ncbi:MAG: response regulator [Acidobacteria bacterium]|nr:response regulator [Acidobacteriota bacterium]
MKKRLLLADDSVTIQKVIQLLFADEPVEVRVAQHGEEALDLVFGWQPDILLADVLLPGMDGYDLCKRAKQHQIPVVLLVGTFEPFDFVRAEESGYDAYLTKPFDTERLIEITRELTRKGGPHDRTALNTPAAERILEFDEAPCPAPPGVLQIGKLDLNPWDYEIIPQPEPELPAMPVFRPAGNVAGHYMARDVKAEVTSVLERLLPRWMETLRAELSAELERIS